MGPASKEGILALLNAGLAMDMKTVQGAVRAHLDALNDVDGSLVTSAKGFQDATVATAKLIASAPPAAIKNVFDTVPQVQTLNGDWFATMPVADAVKSYQAFFGDCRRSEALSAGGAAVKGPATGPPFDLWFFFKQLADSRWGLASVL